MEQVRQRVSPKEREEIYQQIYLDKMGYESVEDTEQSKPKLSYTDLTIKYGYSINWLQQIVAKMKNKFNKEENNE